jgi:enamine deaminase RidA (YjgF/YER057c/UK114 family)
MSSAIARFPGAATGRSRAVACDGFVWTVATASEKSPSMHAQTVSALQVIDRNLAAAGSDKRRVVSATVYIADMNRKPEMNDAWLAWVDPEHAPQRACVGVTLEGDTLVEIVICAATR